MEVDFSAWLESVVFESCHHLDIVVSGISLRVVEERLFEIDTPIQYAELGSLIAAESVLAKVL